MKHETSQACKKGKPLFERSVSSRRISLIVRGSMCSSYAKKSKRQDRISCTILVYRFYQGVLYFQSVKGFYDTRGNIISFMPIRKARPSLRRFS